MPARRCAARALQHELPAHELAIILADRAGRRGRSLGRTRRRSGSIPRHRRTFRRRARQDGAGLVELVADHGIGGRGEILPLGLGRQACARPAGKGVGLEIADVRDRSGPVDLAPSAKRELRVRRRASRGAPRCVRCWTQAQPSRQPQGRGAIAAVVDELAPFPVGDAAARELRGREEDAVPRTLAVEGEAVGPARRSRRCLRVRGASSEARPRSRPAREARRRPARAGFQPTSRGCR